MAYAFSRDGAMPLSSLWHKVNKQEVPIHAVWLSVSVSFCMALTVRYILYLWWGAILAKQKWCNFFFQNYENVQFWKNGVIC